MPKPQLTVRYAESDQDIIAVHCFLCVVAGPSLPGPIDPHDSAVEVWRCTKHDAVIMAISAEGLVVGAFGIVQPTFWWNNKLKFLANRFLFALPGSGAYGPLLREGREIARKNGLELHVLDEFRGRYLIFNKDARRKAPNPFLTPLAEQSAPSRTAENPDVLRQRSDVHH